MRSLIAARSSDFGVLVSWQRERPFACLDRRPGGEHDLRPVDLRVHDNLHTCSLGDDHRLLVEGAIVLLGRLAGKVKEAPDLVPGRDAWLLVVAAIPGEMGDGLRD